MIKLILVITQLVVWGTIALAKDETSAAKLLDDMGEIKVSQRTNEDLLLRRDLELATRSKKSDVIVLLNFAYREARTRQSLAFEMSAPEINRFIEIEERVVAEKDISKEIFVQALKKHASNPLFTLSVARLAIERHGEAILSELKEVILDIDPGMFEVEWFLLAREISRSQRAPEYVSFFRHGLRYNELSVGDKGQLSKFKSEELLWILFTAIGPDADRVVLEGLDSRNVLERRSATMLAGMLLVDGAAEKIARILSDASDPTAQIFAARSLGSLLAYAHAPTLERAASSPVPDVRVSALAALGELALDRSLKTILSKLSDRDPLVRRAASIALSRYVDRSLVVKRLEELVLSERVTAVKKAAVVSLSASPIEQGTTALARLHKKEKNDTLLANSLEEAMKEQIVHASRGKLLPQFAFYDEQKRLVTGLSIVDARQKLTEAVDKTKRFSAQSLASLAPGLESEDISTLKRARRLMALFAANEIVAQEISTANALIRSLLAKSKP